MKINSSEFCYLSTSETFLGWLYRSSPILHGELIDHLKKSAGCAANRKKMLAILKSIQKDRHLAESLSNFIRDHFPQMIEEDSDADKVSESRKIMNVHNVFAHYDPSLNTFPRKLIITERSGTPLSRDVLSMGSRYGYYEHLIIEDRAYIEYLSQEHMGIKDDIPEKNWEIRAYKRANNLK